MAGQTTNFKLVKPAPEEFYDVAVPNGNMDKIDAALKELQENGDLTQIEQDLSELETKVTQHLDEIISSTHLEGRGVNLPGIQTINVLPNRKPKLIRVDAFVSGGTSASFGSWALGSQNRSVITFQTIYQSSGSIVDISSSVGNGIYGTVKNPRKGSFDIEWVVAGSGFANSNAYIALNIEVIYHGDDE